MSEGKVTIVIVTFNAYEYVKKCLESVLLYTNKKHQIVVVDNNSDSLTRNYLIELKILN